MGRAMIPTPHQWWQADGSGGGDGQGSEGQVTAESAREFLTGFGHAPESLKAMPDADVLKLHGTVSGALTEREKAAMSKGLDGWREAYVARMKENAAKSGDKAFDEGKLLGRLQRYGSFDAALDALIGVQNKISAGELKALQTFPAKGTEEQQAAWRKSQGLPEKPDGYEIKLPDGVALGEQDQPFVDSFKAVAHGAHMTPGQVNAAVAWYLNTVQEQEAARHEADLEVRDRVEDELRAEWAGDYRKNKALIETFLDQGGAGVKEAFLNARLADGTPLASDPSVLRFLVDRAREVIDAATVVPPGDAASMGKSIEDEIRQIAAWMGAPRGSEEYKKYWGDQRVQERYRQLVAARDKIAARGR